MNKIEIVSREAYETLAEKVIDFIVYEKNLDNLSGIVAFADLSNAVMDYETKNRIKPTAGARAHHILIVEYGLLNDRMFGLFKYVYRIRRFLGLN